MSDLPHLLYAKRKQRGDSQADVARFINDWLRDHGFDMTDTNMTTSQAAISKIEAGLSKPIQAKIPAFAAYLGISEGQAARAASPDALGESVAVLREQLIEERARSRRLEQTNEDLMSEVAQLQAEIQRQSAALRRLERRMAPLEAEVDKATAATRRRKTRAT